MGGGLLARSTSLSLMASVLAQKALRPCVSSWPVQPVHVFSLVAKRPVPQLQRSGDLGKDGLLQDDL